MKEVWQDLTERCFSHPLQSIFSFYFVCLYFITSNTISILHISLINILRVKVIFSFLLPTLTYSKKDYLNFVSLCKLFRNILPTLNFTWRISFKHPLMDFSIKETFNNPGQGRLWESIDLLFNKADKINSEKVKLINLNNIWIITSNLGKNKRKIMKNISL